MDGYPIIIPAGLIITLLLYLIQSILSRRNIGYKVINKRYRNRKYHQKRVKFYFEEVQEQKAKQNKHK